MMGSINGSLLRLVFYPYGERIVNFSALLSHPRLHPPIPASYPISDGFLALKLSHKRGGVNTILTSQGKGTWAGPKSLLTGLLELARA